MRKILIVGAVLLSLLSIPAVSQASYHGTQSGPLITISDSVLGISYTCGQIIGDDGYYTREWKCILNGVEYWATCWTEMVDYGDGGGTETVRCDISGMTSQPAVGTTAAAQYREQLLASLRGGGYAYLPNWNNPGRVKAPAPSSPPPC
jgi:hypothetical protein